jgi:hypothetical protein
VKYRQRQVSVVAGRIHHALRLRRIDGQRIGSTMND